VFPSYLFFVASETQRYRAMTTNRIANTLAVPRQEQLIAQLRSLHRVLLARADFVRSRGIRSGRWARIVSGPLAGVEGVVRQWRSPLRIALNVDILGQAVSVETDVDCVEPSAPPAHAASH
jgi:transcription antitermination factor NusG